MLKIKKIFNNNVVLVHDVLGLEQILIGKGIAFGKGKGSIVEKREIDKTFVVDSPEITNRFIQLTKEIPINHLELVTKIVKDAEEQLGYTFSDMTYIGLADHISYALNRYRKGHKIVNALLLEIKKFYPKEFAAALSALDTISYYEDIKLQEDEAGFIALHFVNGEQNNDATLTILTTEILQKVVLIVEDYLSVELNEGSMSYLRFLTHLKYFIRRITNNEESEQTMPDIFEQIVHSFPIARDCVDVIIKYLEEKLNCKVFPDEQVYLILHIQRLMK